MGAGGCYRHAAPTELGKGKRGLGGPLLQTCRSQRSLGRKRGVGWSASTDMPLLRSLGGVAPAENEKGGVVDPVLHTCRSYGAWEAKRGFGESGSIHMPLLTELRKSSS